PALAGIRRGGAVDRLRPDPHPVAPDHPQRRRPAGCAGHARPRQRHPGVRRAVVPRLGHGAADGGMGLDGRRGARTGAAMVGGGPAGASPPCGWCWPPPAWAPASATGPIPMPTAAEPLLQVRDLRTWFLTDSGPVRAVDGVSFDVHAGETLGVVGESGSGKSVCAKSIIRLLDEPARIVGGTIMFKGRDLAHLDDEGIREVRGREIAMVFQDPMTSLNPVLRIA